jgi:hypothetical protein
MVTVAETPRQKIWLVLVLVAVLPGAVSASPNVAATLGVLSFGVAFYAAPILFYKYVLSRIVGSSNPDGEPA